MVSVDHCELFLYDLYIGVEPKVVNIHDRCLCCLLLFENLSGNETTKIITLLYTVIWFFSGLSTILNQIECSHKNVYIILL